MRCEGWSRGGVFSFGRSTTWVQCKAEAVVMIKAEQENEVTHENEITTMPACTRCWKVAIAYGTTILSVRPITKEDEEASNDDD